MFYEKIPLNLDIGLDLPHFEDIGSKVNDISRNHIGMTLTGVPVWTELASHKWVLTYTEVHPDFLQCPAADSTLLDFTALDYTLLAWVYPTGGGADLIMNKGVVDVCGWEFYLFIGGPMATLALRHNQAGSHQGASATDMVTPNAWNLVTVTRSGLACQFYVNGIAVATVLDPGGMIDPVSAVAKKFLIGIQDNELVNAWDGMMDRHRAWSRALTAAEIANIFTQERSKYGV
jgi:hypothetical protein